MTVLALSVVLFAGAVCGSSVPSRIVGGTDASEAQYTSIAQVDFLDSSSGTWSQKCAATILNQIYVLSAAHCFDGPNYSPSQRQIRAGSISRNSGGTIATVNYAFNHPEYGMASTFDADISVVRLASMLTFSTTIQASPIIAAGSELPDGLTVTLAGWGDTEQGGSAASTLQAASVSIVNREECRQRYLQTPRQHNVTENMICAGLLDVGGRDACTGDSGGPVYFDDNVLVGVISWGEGCALASFPGVNTRVSAYTEWIIATAI